MSLNQALNDTLNVALTKVGEVIVALIADYVTSEQPMLNQALQTHLGEIQGTLRSAQAALNADPVAAAELARAIGRLVALTILPINTMDSRAALSFSQIMAVSYQQHPAAVADLFGDAKIALFDKMPGIDIHVGDDYGTVANIADFSGKPLSLIETECKATELPFKLDSWQVDPESPTDTNEITLFLPRFASVSSHIGVLRDESLPGCDGTDGDSDCEVVLELEGKSYRVFYGLMLACADRVTPVVFLSQTPRGFATTDSGELQTFNKDSFAYLCLHFMPEHEDETLPAPTEARWFCGDGFFGDGVVGYALKNGAPRPFFAKSLNWRGKSFDAHWEFTGGLGSVASATVSSPSYYTEAYAWNLNPRDTHPAGFARAGQDKTRDWLAGIAAKTSTNRTGVAISVYNNNDYEDEAHTENTRVIDGVLNQCEPGCTALPDVASNGTLEHGILINVQVNEWYSFGSANCEWPFEWRLDQADLVPAASEACQSFDIDPTGTQTEMTAGKPVLKPILGVNLADGAVVRRCPTWTDCPPGADECCYASIHLTFSGAAGQEENMGVYGLGADGSGHHRRGAHYHGTRWRRQQGFDGPSQFSGAKSMRVDGGNNSNADRCVLDGKDGSVRCYNWPDHSDQAAFPLTAGISAADKEAYFSNGAPTYPIGAGGWSLLYTNELDPATGEYKPLTGIEQLVRVESCPWSHCGRRADGTVWCWGAFYRIGHSNRQDFNTTSSTVSPHIHGQELCNDVIDNPGGWGNFGGYGSTYARNVGIDNAIKIAGSGGYYDAWGWNGRLTPASYGRCYTFRHLWVLRSDHTVTDVYGPGVLSRNLGVMCDFGGYPMTSKSAAFNTVATGVKDIAVAPGTSPILCVLSTSGVPSCGGHNITHNGGILTGVVSITPTAQRNQDDFCAITATREVVCWDTATRIGRTIRTPNMRPLGGISRLEAVDADNVMCAVTKGGGLWCWQNVAGTATVMDALGLARSTKDPSPAQSVKLLACGENDATDEAEVVAADTTGDVHTGQLSVPAGYAGFVKLTSPGGELYAKWDAPPTESDYDCGPDSYTFWSRYAGISCDMAPPGATAATLHYMAKSANGHTISKGIYQISDTARRLADAEPVFEFDDTTLGFEKSFYVVEGYSFLVWAESADTEVQVELEVSDASGSVLCLEVGYGPGCRVDGAGGQELRVSAQYLAASTRMRVRIAVVGPPCDNDSDCGDGIACTVDQCTVGRGGSKRCRTTPVDGICDDGSVCTTDDQCIWGQGCHETEHACNDEDNCTVDSCDESTGKCEFAPVQCADGLLCSDGACYDPCVYNPSDPMCGCANGVQDHGESGVDCGGPCAACGALSCHSLLLMGYESDGEYLIDPDGPAGFPPTLAQCDMTTAGGGWTLISSYTDDSDPQTVLRTSLPLLDSGVPGQIDAQSFARLNGTEILLSRRSHPTCAMTSTGSYWESYQPDLCAVQTHYSVINRIAHVAGTNGAGQQLRSGWHVGAPTASTTPLEGDHYHRMKHWDIKEAPSWPDYQWCCKHVNIGFRAKVSGNQGAMTNLTGEDAWRMDLSRTGTPRAWVRGFNDRSGRVFVRSKMISGDAGSAKLYTFEVPGTATTGGIVTLTPPVAGNGESVTMMVRKDRVPAPMRFDQAGPVVGGPQAIELAGLEPGTHFVKVLSDTGYADWHLLMQYDGEPKISCGDAVCDPGEDCYNCAFDCDGEWRNNGALVWCCGDGILFDRREGVNGEVCDGHF